jgi:hypothetical protein
MERKSLQPVIQQVCSKGHGLHIRFVLWQIRFVHTKSLAGFDGSPALLADFLH